MQQHQRGWRISTKERITRFNSSAVRRARKKRGGAGLVTSVFNAVKWVQQSRLETGCVGEIIDRWMSKGKRMEKRHRWDKTPSEPWQIKSTNRLSDQPRFQAPGTRGVWGGRKRRAGPPTRMQSERAMNALARRNQSAAEHQEKCCFWEALPDADEKAHASREDGEAGVEMKRPASCKPHSIFLSLFSLQLRRMPRQGLGKEGQKKFK